MSTLNFSALTKTKHISLNMVNVKDTTIYHSHNFIEIAFVYDGKGFHTINGKTFPTKKGDLTIINNNSYHQFTSTENLKVANCVITTSAYYEIISFSPFDQSKFIFDHYNLDKKDYIKVNSNALSYPEIANFFDKMLEIFKIQNFGYVEILFTYIFQMLTFLYNFSLSYTNSEKSQANSIIEYIIKNFTSNLQIDDICKKFNLSKSSFHRKIKAITKTNFTDFIQTLRIEEACRLLVSTNLKIVEISKIVGYSDLKYFYSVFKKKRGLLPSEVRKSVKTNHS